MPSDCIVPVVKVRNIREHPGADMLSIVEVLGYQVVTSLVEAPRGSIERHFVPRIRDERGRRIPANGDYPEDIAHLCDVVDVVHYRFRYKEGDRAVYFPADTVLTDEWAEKFEVSHLLKTGNRVSRTRLRGEPSFGLIVELPEGADWQLGQNVADYYGATKWAPPADKVSAPDTASYDSDIDPHFVKYTNIQNGLLLYNKFQKDEEVVATEKIHGKNCRIGMINGDLQVGSRTCRKNPVRGCIFRAVASRPGVAALLSAVQEAGAKVVILFGEIYGQGVQSLHYGRNKKSFRAFDVYVDGKFLDFHEFADLCELHGVKRAPVLYRGPFDLEKIKKISVGKSSLPGAENIREGVVVRPIIERRNPALGRVIFKFISTDYDLSKHKKKDTMDV